MTEIEVVENCPFGNKHLSIAGTLVSPIQGEVPVRMYHNLDKPIKIKTGKPIALYIAAIKEDRVGNALPIFDRTGELKTLFQDLQIGNLPIEQKESLEKMLMTNHQSIQIPGQDLGRCAIIQHHIYTEDQQPIFLAPYRVPYHQMDTLHKEIQEMEDQGVIEPSNSPWSAPIVQVKKPDGSL